MAVITISRQFGSGGDEIAELVCEALNYQLFDKKMIIRAAVEAGISDQEVMDFSEEKYQVKGFFDRLFGRSRTVAQMRTWREETSGVRVVETMDLTEEHALVLVQKSILAAHESGNVIIVGRGGQALLKDFKDVLHVRVVASIEDRVRMAMKRYELLRHGAYELIDGRDTASSEYIKQFYNTDWSEPQLYHMILNTSKLSFEAATELIVKAVEHLQPEAAGT